jgi:uncharacterized membrane protein
MEKRITGLGRLFYAIGIIGIGGQHFYNAEFVPVILPSLPASLQGQYFWTSLAGTGLIITGGAIAIGKGARAAAILLGAVLLALVIFWDIPHQVATNLRSLGAWTNSFKALTLAGGALVAAASLPDAGSARWDRRFVSFGCYAIAITAAVFGVDHFLYVAFVASLVPAWIPGHVFWTYFCGAALIAAGLGMILRIKARLAAGLLGGMIFVWLLVLHIPLAIAEPRSGKGNEWTSVFEALAFSGIAFILSRVLPRTSAAPLATGS